MAKRDWCKRYGDTYEIKALKPDGEFLSYGTVALRFDAEGQAYDVYDNPVTPRPHGETKGWGALSGKDMIYVVGGIIHRAWYEELREETKRRLERSTN